MGTIEISNLTKKYKTNTGLLTVLSGINLDIPASSVTALTGPNGAGKTTLLKILSCLIIPDSGTVKMAGFDCIKDIQKIKQNTGFVFNPETSFYPQLTLKENLSFFCILFNVGLKKIDQLSEIFDLNNFLSSKFVFCSSGIKQRAAIARALLHDPKILLIDEPTKSLDSDSSDKIHNIIKSVNKQQGTTVLFASHNTLEIEKLSSRCIYLKEGKIV